MPIAPGNTAQEAIKNIAFGGAAHAAAKSHGAQACCPVEQARSACGSRRRRVWDLEHACYCPLVGVGVPLEVLRKLTTKALPHCADASDYEIHATAVSECNYRSKLAELLQAELDTRYVRDVLRFRGVKTSAALGELWRQALRSGDVAGPYWAALTHPCCDAVLQATLGEDLHMFQHQAGAGARLEVARFKAVVQEHAVLGRELGRVQERMTRVMAEKAAEMDRLQAELVRTRARVVAKDAQLIFLQQDLTALQSSIAQFEARQRLQSRLQDVQARSHGLEQQNADLRRRLASAERAGALSTASRAVAHSSPATGLPPAQAESVGLQHKVILCVGGRTGSLASYRDVVERVGGQFAHHDGGLEDSHNVLDASLAAADLVICQTGCISHNAYWKVKNFCKRTGKQCVFVENPSASSLSRGLETMVGKISDATPAQRSDGAVSAESQVSASAA